MGVLSLAELSSVAAAAWPRFIFRLQPLLPDASFLLLSVLKMLLGFSRLDDKVEGLEFIAN